MPRQRPRDIPVVRGDQVTLDVEGLGDGPDGLARIDQYVVFGPGVLPGERATVEITSAARKFGRGELVKLQTTSEDRVEPRCAHFLACGGCHRQHQHYDAQLLGKQQRLQKAIDRALGDTAPVVGPTIAAASPYGERHKIAVHLRHDSRGRLVAGFHRLRSPELTQVHECPASDPLAWDLVERTVELLGSLGHRAWDPWFAPQELLRSVLVRTTTDSEAHLVLVATAPGIPGLDTLFAALHAAGATSISVNHNPTEPARLLGPDTELVSGRPFVHELLHGLAYRIGPTSFFQTSPRMAERLIDGVIDWLQPDRHDDVGDLYCGGGLLTLPLAQRARSAFGIERNGRAVDDARASAQRNRIDNVIFRAGDVGGWLAACRRGDLPRPHLVALDPPREGMAPDVLAALAQLAPRRLAYVSCEPDTLQRDLRALHDHGFAVQSVTPYDMFPQTCHVESLACLARKG
jgi:23S rRNA (uracil1939-C5)-methyltransferase